MNKMIVEKKAWNQKWSEVLFLHAKGDKDMMQNIFVGVMFAAVIIVSGLVWWYENSSAAKKEDTQGETDEKHSAE